VSAQTGQAPDTLARPLRFIVHGAPVPQGSKRVVRGRLIDASKGLKPYRASVSAAAAEALGLPTDDPSALQAALAALPVARGAVAVSLRFGLVRPRGHYGTGRNADVLRPSAPVWPATKPDVDKLERAVLDALTGIVWADDSQVVVLNADKVYSPTPLTYVTVTRAPHLGAYSGAVPSGLPGGLGGGGLN